MRSTTFDGAGRITDIDHVKSGTSRAKFTYSLDANDNVLYEKRGHNANLYEVFTYDKRNELDTVWYDGTSSSSPSVYSKKVEHVWDGAWNLDTKTTTIYGSAAATVDYTANSRNEYTAIGGDSPTWTSNGELADDDIVQTYKYDYRGRLTKVTRGGSNYTFKHDALGRRISTNFGAELRFTWLEMLPLEEITSASTPTVNAMWTWGATGEPLRLVRSGVVRYMHGNKDRSIEKLTDSSGASVETLEYEAFGCPSQSSSASGSPLAWRSRWMDYVAGLYARPRTYEPTVLMRPIVAADGSDFGFAGDDPMAAPPRPAVERAARAVVISHLEFGFELPHTSCLTCPYSDGRDPMEGGGEVPPGSCICPDGSIIPPCGQSCLMCCIQAQNPPPPQSPSQPPIVQPAGPSTPTAPAGPDTDCCGGQVPILV